MLKLCLHPSARYGSLGDEYRFVRDPETRGDRLLYCRASPMGECRLVGQSL